MSGLFEHPDNPDMPEHLQFCPATYYPDRHGHHLKKVSSCPVVRPEGKEVLEDRDKRQRARRLTVSSLAEMQRALPCCPPQLVDISNSVHRVPPLSTCLTRGCSRSAEGLARCESNSAPQLSFNQLHRVGYAPVQTQQSIALRLHIVTWGNMGATSRTFHPPFAALRSQIAGLAQSKPLNATDRGGRCRWQSQHDLARVFYLSSPYTNRFSKFGSLSALHFARTCPHCP
jgi:hypothetical protein